MAGSGICAVQQHLTEVTLKVLESENINVVVYVPPQ